MVSASLPIKKKSLTPVHTSKVPDYQCRCLCCINNVTKKLSFLSALIAAEAEYNFARAKTPVPQNSRQCKGAFISIIPSTDIHIDSKVFQYNSSGALWSGSDCFYPQASRKCWLALAYAKLAQPDETCWDGLHWETTHWLTSKWGPLSRILTQPFY